MGGLLSMRSSPSRLKKNSYFKKTKIVCSFILSIVEMLYNYRSHQITYLNDLKLKLMTIFVYWIH